jgi:hypothetical protein
MTKRAPRECPRIASPKCWPRFACDCQPAEPESAPPRPPRYRVAPIAAAVLAATLVAAQAVSQDDTSYAALLDAYVRNDATAAVAALATWPERRVKEAVRGLDKQVGRDRARAAVMLHTEAAFREVADQRESFHVVVARSFVSRLDSSDRDFVARWHALVASLYCVRRDPRRAQLEINQGLAVDGRHPYVNLLAGAFIEYKIAQEEPNLRGQWNVRKQRADILRKELQQAAQIYRVVLSGFPDFLEARLRLGWVLTLNDSPRAAREQLEIVAARATNVDVLYLAHLFLAASHERADHPGDAAREYDVAREVAPYRSSLIALIRIAATAGNVDRARALAEKISAMSATGQNDPWNAYNSCFTGDELFAGLRREARQR